MHAETDPTGYYATLSKLTGHSVRYLRMRTAVRLTLAGLALVIPFTHALPVK